MPTHTTRRNGNGNTNGGTGAPLVQPYVPVLVRSEGQRMLCHVTGTLGAIASEAGIKSAQSIHEWRSGEKQPSAAARAKLDAAYGIPVRAWTLRPADVTTVATTAATEWPASSSEPVSGEQLRAAAWALEPPSEPVETNGPPPTTLEDCMTLLTVIRRDRNQRNLVTAERVKLADTEARILALRHRLEREAELSEDRLVREHPAWQRLKRLIVRALAKHPAAAKDVLAAMAAAGDGGEVES